MSTVCVCRRNIYKCYKQRDRILRLDFERYVLCRADVRLLMMVMTISFDMCHFYIDKISHSLFSNDFWMLANVAISVEFG